MLDTSPIGVNVFRNVFDALTRIEADGSVTPLLAVSWSASEDTKTWEFTIRTNAKFHDGQPITADDIVWNYKRLLGETEIAGQDLHQQAHVSRGVRPEHRAFRVERAICAVRSPGVVDLDHLEAGV